MSKLDRLPITGYILKNIRFFWPCRKSLTGRSKVKDSQSNHHRKLSLKVLVMASALTMTTFDALTKNYYTNDRIYNMTYQNRPFYAMVHKDRSFGGRSQPIPIIVGNPQNRSATFSQAKTRSTQTSTIPKYFDLTGVKDYSLATMDNYAIESTKKDKHAFASAMRTEMDGAINTLTNSIAFNSPRDSSGYMAQVNAEPAEAATTVITLKQINDITGFEVGQELNIFSAKSGGSQRTVDGSEGDMVITAVDRSAGTITINDAYDSSGTIAADDYIFVKGDRGLRLSGVEDWLPFTAPTSGDSHFGVDRSSDPTRLAGVRYDGTSDNIEQAILKLLHRVAREGGGSPDYAFMSYENLQDLILILGSRVQYINVDVPYVKAGFQGVQIIGPNGIVKCIADPFWTSQYVHTLNMSTWTLHSIGEPVALSNTDGRDALRQSDDDGIEIRYRFYGQLSCRGPGLNGVVKVRD